MPSCIYDLHTHTFLCRHAEIVMPRVYFKLASELGYKGVAYCCHNPFPGDTVTPQYRMAMEEFSVFMKMYERECAFAQAHIPDLDILLTMEVDYLPANPSATESFVRGYLGDFDCVLGSLHYYEHIGIASKEGDAGVERFVQQYFEEWIRALRTGLFNVMTHMDFIKVVVGMRWARENRSVIQKYAEEALHKMAEYNAERTSAGLDPVVLELNTGGTQYGDDFLPTASILAYAAKLQIPFCICSDCHQTVEIGRNFKAALEYLKELGVKELYYFKRKRAHMYSVDDALATFKPCNMNKLVTQIKADERYNTSVDQNLQCIRRELSVADTDSL